MKTSQGNESLEGGATAGRRDCFVWRKETDKSREYKVVLVRQVPVPRHVSECLWSC